MSNRLAPLWLLAAVLCGYAIAGRPARAQDTIAGLPTNVVVGTKVTLTFQHGMLSESGYSMSCTVAEVTGNWIRCARDEFGTRRDQDWYNLKRVVRLTKHD